MFIHQRTTLIMVKVSIFIVARKGRLYSKYYKSVKNDCLKVSKIEPLTYVKRKSPGSSN